MRTTRVPENTCPKCGELNDACSSGDGARPSAGDLSVCLYCGHVTVFDEELRHRELSETELSEILAEFPELAKKLALREKVMKRRRQ